MIWLCPLCRKKSRDATCSKCGLEYAGEIYNIAIAALTEGRKIRTGKGWLLTRNNAHADDNTIVTARKIYRVGNLHGLDRPTLCRETGIINPSRCFWQRMGVRSKNVNRKDELCQK